MMTTGTSAQYDSLLVQVADWIRKDAARKHDIASLGCLDIARMAHDLGVGEDDLEAVLPYRLPDDVSVMAPSYLGNGVIQADPNEPRLVRNCTSCRATGRCRYARTSAADDGTTYCTQGLTFAQIT